MFKIPKNVYVKIIFVKLQYNALVTPFIKVQIVGKLSKLGMHKNITLALKTHTYYTDKNTKFRVFFQILCFIFYYFPLFEQYIKLSILNIENLSNSVVINNIRTNSLMYL